MLFDSGLEINSEIVNGDTPLYYASLLISEDAVRFLVERGADLEAPTGCSNCCYEREPANLLKSSYDSGISVSSENAGFGEAGKFGSVVM